MSIRRLSREAIGERGLSIYQAKLRHQLDPSAHGKFVAIDVETEEYELAEEAADAADKLWAKCPDAQVYVERIGHAAAFHAYALRDSVSTS